MHGLLGVNFRKTGAGQCLIRRFAVRLAAAIPALSLSVIALSGPVRADTRQQTAEAVKKAYSFGVFPFLPASRLEAVFAPIGGELGRALGREIQYRSAATYEQFASRLAKQEFDIAHIQPFDYVRIAAPNGYQPMARRNDVIVAAVVVRDDSPIRDMNELHGKTVAMPPESAATAYLGKVILKQAGINPRKDVKITYIEDHHSCIHQMMIGSAAACFTSIHSARLYDKQTGTKLRTIAQSPAIPQTLFVVHARVPRKNRETIRRTLLTTKLPELTPELREFISRDTQQPFIPTKDADYDIVRQYWKLLKAEQ